MSWKSFLGGFLLGAVLTLGVWCAYALNARLDRIEGYLDYVTHLRGA